MTELDVTGLIPGAAEVLLADVLLRPRMSLVHQSYAARERRALPQGVSPSTSSALFAHTCASLCVILACGALKGMAYQQPCLIRGCNSAASQSAAATLTCSEECRWFWCGLVCSASSDTLRLHVAETRHLLGIPSQRSHILRSVVTAQGMERPQSP